MVLLYMYVVMCGMLRCAVLCVMTHTLSGLLCIACLPDSLVYGH